MQISCSMSGHPRVTTSINIHENSKKTWKMLKIQNVMLELE